MINNPDYSPAYFIPAPSVIPAKAGIQGARSKALGLLHSPGFRPSRE